MFSLRKLFFRQTIIRERGQAEDPLCDSGAESQQLDFAPTLSSISRCIGQPTTTTTTSIHCIFTFVGNNKDFHVSTNVIVIIV